MKKLIISEGTEFEQNGKDLALIETDDRAGIPTMISSDDLNEGMVNADEEVKEKLNFDVEGEDVNITPSTEPQVIRPSKGHNAILTANVEAVTSSIDSNIQAGNIKSGVSILGVTGELEPLVGESVEIIPTTSQQEITPVEGNGIVQATVQAVTNDIDSNIAANNIKSGVTILGVTGEVVELVGETAQVTPTTSQQVITPVSGNGITEVTVSAVDASIDSNIQAANIVSGVTILGVEGTASSGGSIHVVDPTAGEVRFVAGLKLSAYQNVNIELDIAKVTSSTIMLETSFVNPNATDSVEVSNLKGRFYDESGNVIDTVSGEFKTSQSDTATLTAGNGDTVVFNAARANSVPYYVEFIFDSQIIGQ